MECTLPRTVVPQSGKTTETLLQQCHEQRFGPRRELPFSKPILLIDRKDMNSKLASVAFLEALIEAI